jgi:hypothetical protein
MKQSRIFFFITVLIFASNVYAQDITQLGPDIDGELIFQVTEILLQWVVQVIVSVAQTLVERESLNGMGIFGNN